MKKEKDVRARPQNAALELFRDHGYDRTTAAEIAAQAGVTERTFFRHFPDKREILFDGEALVRAALTASVADAPVELAPLEILFRAFQAFRPTVEESWSYLKPRHEVISATPALHERELAKIAGLADTLAVALKAWGVPDIRAALAAQMGMAAFAHATFSWLDDPTVGLGERLDFVFFEIKSLLVEIKDV